jgi:hypothetical protein
MQLRVVPAAIVFAGSYLPLSVILLAQNYDYSNLWHSLCWPNAPYCVMPLKNPTFSLVILAVCAACFAATLATLALVTPKLEIRIKEAKYIPADLMNYTLPYVVSFMSIDYQDTAKFTGLVIFLAWMFWITLKRARPF